MKNTYKYTGTLSKYALFNAALLIGVTVAFSATAASITEDLNLNGASEARVYDETVDIDANVTLKNTSITAHDTITVAGKNFSIDNSKLTADLQGDAVGGQGLVIDGGNFALSHNSELFGEPKVTINGGTFQFDSSHLLSGVNESTSTGTMDITGGELTFETGLMGAYNNGTGTATGRLGGDINMSGNSRVTFKGGNDIDEAKDWEELTSNSAGGRFIANEILANKVNLTDNAELTIASGATVKTTQRKEIDDDKIDFTLPTSTFVLSDNSQLKLSGALRGNVAAGETAGTLLINDTNAFIKGSIDGVNLTADQDWTLTSGEDTKVISLGDVYAKANLDMTLPTEKDDEGDYSQYGSMNIGDITLGEGRKLSITSNQTHPIVMYEGSYKYDISELLGGDLGFGINSTLNLKDVTLNNTNANVYAEKVSINMDDAVAKNMNIAFLDSTMNLDNYSEMRTAETAAFSGTKVKATNSGLSARDIHAFSSSDITLNNGWLRRDLDSSPSGLFSFDNANLVAKNGTEILANNLEVVNGGKVDLQNSTLLASGTINLQDGTIDIDSSLFGAAVPGEVDLFDRPFAGVNLDLDDGTVNVKGNTTIIASKVNVDNTFNVKKGAVLTTATEAVRSEHAYNKEKYTPGTHRAIFNVTDNGVLTNDGTINNNITNNGEIYNNGTINGNVSNKGMYEGLISAVTGTFDNTTGQVYTWGDLDKDLPGGSVTVIKPAKLTQDANLGSVRVEDSLDLDVNKLTAEYFGVQDNATLSLRIADTETFGQVEGAILQVYDGTTLNVKVDQGAIARGETEEFQILNGVATGNFATITPNARYTVEDLGAGLISVSNTASAADVMREAGGNEGDIDAAGAWLDEGSFADGSAAQGIAQRLDDLSQSNPQGFKSAMRALEPETQPVGRTLATVINNQIASAVDTRFLVYSPSGRSGGDILRDEGMWVQGLANKTEFKKGTGFDAKTYGVAIGADAKVAPAFVLGLGYAYSNSDVDSTGRSTDVDTHTAIVYAKKGIGNAFANGMATYSFSQYKEDKNVAGTKVKAKYDMDSVYLQAMTGYHFYEKNAMLTPAVGLRYLWLNPHSYTDSAQQNVKPDKTDALTGVIGARAGMAIDVGVATLAPELKVAATYDLKNDKESAAVHLANGSNYVVKGETLERFGMEVGAKIGVLVQNIEASLSYEGRFRKDYTDHTGLGNLRYNF